ncbi:MAG: histidinol dehydrogenase [Thermoanaerobaculia bacterium]|nr:histidinol dehydrogenase [Thermoanaerobaculia bacterium]
MRIIELNEGASAEWLTSLERARIRNAAEAREIATAILSRVRSGGDAEVAKLLLELDGVEIVPRSLVVRPGEGRAEPELESAIDLAISRIESFHRVQRSCPSSNGETTELRQEAFPLGRVGIYVPGGKAVYLSTLIMCAIPARIAGVGEIVVATTPRVAAREEFQLVCTKLGVTEVYRCGGAAGIAALAYGTESLRRVDKVVGPGNRFVAAAKELVRDVVGIDLPAGPSEIVVVADETADATLIAADLLAQAEHGADSLAVCVTTSRALGEEVAVEVDRRLAAGAEGARAAIEAFGGVFLVPSIDEAAALAGAIAPEHLSVQVRDASRVVDRVRNCAAIFVGAHSAVALGDYVAGSNHVLPTAGAARFSSSLGVSDFMRRRTIVTLSRKTVEAIGPAAVTLAEFEGLPLHAESVRARSGVRSAVAAESRSLEIVR